MNPLIRSVDIIIILNSTYEDLKESLENILKYTSDFIHQIIIMNNTSDEKLIQYLSRFFELNNIVILSNDKWENYRINNANKTDIVVLQSGIIVTNGWIRKLQKCVYKSDEIVTASVLLNKDNIQGAFQDSKSEKEEIQKQICNAAEVAEKSSLNLMPQISAPYNDCVYIKTEVLSKTGDLRCGKFKSWNLIIRDFSYRAEELGYIHILCDNTFVFSLNSRKEFYEEEKKELYEMYPYQTERDKNGCISYEEKKVWENFEIRLKINKCIKNGKKNILYQVQTDFGDESFDAVGGTPLHVKDLTMGLKNKFNIIVLARKQTKLNVTLYSGEEKYKLQFDIGKEPKYEKNRNYELRRIYINVFSMFSVELVHVHHIYGLGSEIYYVAKDFDIPIITTLHDYYYECPCIKLLDCNEKLCIEADSGEKCSYCLSKNIGIEETISYIKNWRMQHERLLKWSDKIIIPSQSAKEINKNYFPNVESKMCVIEHGVKQCEPIKNQCNNVKKTFNVAFLGGVGSVAKGSKLICDMVRKCKKDISWYVFGAMGHCELAFLEQDNLIKTGEYKREELPELISQYQIDLVAILSVWPETYCYTLSESISCGIPVIGIDIGAVGERIKKTDCGWTIPLSSSWNDILEKIKWIKENKKEYSFKKNNVEHCKLKSLDEMLLEYEKLYIAITAKNNMQIFDNKKIDNEYILGAVDPRYMSNEMMLDKLYKVEQNLEKVQRSKAYKIARRLETMNIPFKDELIKIGCSLVYKRRKRNE